MCAMTHLCKLGANSRFFLSFSYRGPDIGLSDLAARTSPAESSHWTQVSISCQVLQGDWKVSETG